MAKEPSAAQLAARKKLGEASKARAAAKKAEKAASITEELSAIPPEVDDVETPEQPERFEPEHKMTVDAPDYGDLIRQINELKDMQWKLMKDSLNRGETVNGNSSTNGGKLTGTYERYLMGADHYPDPSERLGEEAKLQRFAFQINFELRFTVGETSYTSIDGIRTKEPKFTLELVRVVMDEDTGEPTNGRYVVCQLMMHEDPETALIIAKDNGLTVESKDELTFLNEMRYIRMREWLLECFYPPKANTKKAKRDMVIDGRLVQYYEVTDEDGSDDGVKVDFSKLKKISFK